MDHLLSQIPDLELVVTADGEKGNWTFSETLNPDVEVLDFWHACGATLLVNMRDIEPRKEDDGFDGAFLSP